MESSSCPGLASRGPVLRPRALWVSPLEGRTPLNASTAGPRYRRLLVFGTSACCLAEFSMRVTGCREAGEGLSPGVGRPAATAAASCACEHVARGNQAPVVMRGRLQSLAGLAGLAGPSRNIRRLFAVFRLSIRCWYWALWSPAGRTAGPTSCLRGPRGVDSSDWCPRHSAAGGREGRPVCPDLPLRARPACCAQPRGHVQGEPGAKVCVSADS